MKVNTLVAGAGLALAAAVANAAPNLQTAQWSGQKLRPLTIAPLYMVDGELVAGPEIPVSPFGQRRPGEAQAFDQYWADQASADGLEPVGANQAPCALAGPDSRYFGGTGYNNVNTVNDYANAAFAGQTLSTVGMAIYHNPLSGAAEDLTVRVFWWNEFNTDCSGFATGSDSIGAARGFAAGFQAGFGPVPPGQGYYILEIDQLQPLSIEFPANGAYQIQFLQNATAGSQTFSSRTQPMLWGTPADANPPPAPAIIASNPGGPGNPAQWDDDNPYTPFPGAWTPGPFGTPTSECYDLAAAVCVRPLGNMITWFVAQDTQPLPFALISPANGTQSSNLNPTFEWEATTPLPQSYTVKVSLNADLSNPTFTASNIVNVNTFTVPPEATLQPCTQYYWGVEAVNGALITQSTPVSHSYFTSSVDLSADFNLDGQVDFFDYLDFANAFSAEDPSADFNGDGQVDFFDYLDFANAYGANC